MQEAPRAALEQFTVEKNGDILLLPVIFAGKTHQFVLDTGSALTVYDSSFSLGGPIKSTLVETASGNKKIEMFRSPNAQLGNLGLRVGELVLADDFNLLRQVSGHEIRGAIGMDFLKGKVVQIDINSGKVLIMSQATENLGERIPIFFEWEGPCIEVNLPGLKRPEKFLIDTGTAKFGNMKKELLEMLAREGKGRKVGTTLAAGMAGSQVQGPGWLNLYLSGDLNTGTSTYRQGRINSGSASCPDTWSLSIFPMGCCIKRKATCPIATTTST